MSLHFNEVSQLLARLQPRRVQPPRKSVCTIMNSFSLQSASPNTSVICAQGLSKKFDNDYALQHIDLSIKPGGVTAILGANGAGKTTFILCCLGLSKQSSGMLTIFGEAPGSIVSKRRIGVMLQDADLPDLLTPQEHITLFASYYPNPENIDEILNTCKLTEFADKKYRKLSGGQKRRVQFALAIIGDPDLVFLDEPTTGLDTETRRMLWDVVRKLAKTGRTIILTTHYLEEADVLADRVVVVKAGRIIADGVTAEIRELAGGGLIKCISNVSEDYDHLFSQPGVFSLGQTAQLTKDKNHHVKQSFFYNHKLLGSSIRSGYTSSTYTHT